MADSQRGFNIGVFRAEIATKDIARPNLFIAEFNVPPGLQGDGISLNTARYLEYWVEVAAIPDVTFNTYSGQRYGYGNFEQRPILNTFSEMQFDIIFDTLHINYDFFSRWMNLIINRVGSNGPIPNTGVNGASQNEIEYRDNYVADITIYTFDQQGNIIKQIVLRDAFPKALGSIRSAWSDNNSAMRLPVQFSFNDWYEVKQIVAPTSIPPSPLPPLK